MEEEPASAKQEASTEPTMSELMKEVRELKELINTQR
jgi:hypothetical protein